MTSYNSFEKIILGYSSALINSDINGVMFSSRRSNHYKKDKQRLWMAQNGICWWCGKQCVIDGLGGDKNQFTLDHIIPLGAGGTNHWKNCVGSCFACNNGRNKKWEFVKRISFNKPIDNSLREEMTYRYEEEKLTILI